MKKVNQTQPIKPDEHIRQLEVNAGARILIILWALIIILGIYLTAKGK